MFVLCVCVLALLLRALGYERSMILFSIVCVCVRACVFSLASLPGMGESRLIALLVAAPVTEQVNKKSLR